MKSETLLAKSADACLYRVTGHKDAKPVYRQRYYVLRFMDGRESQVTLAENDASAERWGKAIAGVETVLG